MVSHPVRAKWRKPPQLTFFHCAFLKPLLLTLFLIQRQRSTVCSYSKLGTILGSWKKFTQFGHIYIFFVLIWPSSFEALDGVLRHRNRSKCQRGSFWDLHTKSCQKVTKWPALTSHKTDRTRPVFNVLKIWHLECSYILNVTYTQHTKRSTSFFITEMIFWQALMFSNTFSIHLDLDEFSSLVS